MSAFRFHEEVLHEGFGQFLDVESVMHQERSRYQELMIVQTRIFGRVLILDGIVQTTEHDNHSYHEMLVHVPVFAHGEVHRVLIVGGGDGGCLREALRHPGITATLVDIDEAVIRAARQFMPSLSDGAFDHPRARIVIADAVEYMRRDGPGFDVIIIDSTDPVTGPGEVLFSEAFYAACRARLTAGGLLVAQNGVPFVQPEDLRNSAQRLSAVFADTGFYLVSVPSYTGGAMTLGWASDNPALRRVERGILAARFRDAGFATRYYTPDIHVASFALPPFVQELISPR